MLPKVIALVSAGLPKANTGVASGSDDLPKLKDTCFGSSAFFEAPPKRNAGGADSFLSAVAAVMADVPNENVDPVFVGSLLVTLAAAVTAEPNANVGAAASTFLVASPKLKVGLLSLLSAPNVLPKVGIAIFGSSGFETGVVVPEAGVPNAKTGGLSELVVVVVDAPPPKANTSGLSVVDLVAAGASVFLSRELVPNAKIAGRGADEADVLVVDAVAAVAVAPAICPKANANEGLASEAVVVTAVAVDDSVGAGFVRAPKVKPDKDGEVTDVVVAAGLGEEYAGGKLLVVVTAVKLEAAVSGADATVEEVASAGFDSSALSFLSVSVSGLGSDAAGTSLTGLSSGMVAVVDVTETGGEKNEELGAFVSAEKGKQNI